MTSEQSHATNESAPLTARLLPTSLGSWCGSVTQSFAGAIFPPECQICNVPLPSGDRVCELCHAAIVSSGNCCQRCAMPLPDVLPTKDCIRCRGKKWAFRNVLALGPYQGQLSEIVVQLKKPSQEPVRQAIGKLLSDRLLAYCEDLADNRSKAVLIPVPNHWSHSFGYAANTAGLLAAAISEFSQIPVTSRAVRRTRKTRKQGMLAWTDRTRNVAGAFKILRANHITGRHVFLVDDVLTSGATAAEIAKVLRRGGATQVDVLVAARGTGTKSL